MMPDERLIPDTKERDRILDQLIAKVDVLATTPEEFADGLRELIEILTTKLEVHNAVTR